MITMNKKRIARLETQKQTIEIAAAAITGVSISDFVSVASRCKTSC